MSTAEQIDGTAVVAMYFEDRITEAQQEVEAARTALAAAEAKVAYREGERDAFAKDGTLPAPASDISFDQPGWLLCEWALNRVGDVAFKDMTPAGDAVYNRLRAESAAVHGWLEEHGYTVPSVFRGKP
ncbi:hypothetical protein M1P56_35670 (plasmid) [Streptomyces sp. HU2014]|uniref:hypothetical protein n=1 Tax=Streptomyces sp. HU2014 TaxID=2939414 RepID=UPI00200CEBCF|nr:hypothetical protein [Streptomyces sp. HU2014]UQI49831.1 hypothetical protein M1P56_35670 [Streptomyces sp. HU2014]